MWTNISTDIHFFFFRVLPTATATRKKSAQTQTHIRNECSNLTFGGETKNKNIHHFFSWRVSVGFVNESRNSAHINNFKFCNTNLSNTLPVMNVSIFMLFCFPYFLFLLLFGCYFHLKLFVFIVLSHFFGISVILSRWIQILSGDKTKQTNGKKMNVEKINIDLRACILGKINGHDSCFSMFFPNALHCPLLFFSVAFHFFSSAISLI